MAFRGILPEAPSFGTQLARGLGGGFGSGLSKSADIAQQLALKKAENPQVLDSSQDSYNSLIDLVGKGNVGRGSGIKGFFGGETAEDIGAFESSLVGLESSLRQKLVGSGRLTDTQFNFLTKKIMPSYGDSLDEIKGKLKSIGRELNLNPESIERISELEIPRGYREKSGAKQSQKQRKENRSVMVKMRGPDGSFGEVPKENVKAAMQAGAVVIR